MHSHKLFLLLIILLLCSSVKAQEAYKLPDITRLRCDFGEIVQLDEAAKQIAEKKAKSMYIVYGRKGTAIRYINYLQKEAVNYRYSDIRKFISLNYGGYSEPEKMEVWIIPQAAKEPTINVAAIEKTATLFDKYGYWYQYCPDERVPALKVFANELKQNSSLTAYIIVYYEKKNSDEVQGAKSAQMMIDIREGQRASIIDKSILTKLGIKSSRIFTIDIDYSKSSYASRAELWIVPQGALLPDIIKSKI